MGEYWQGVVTLLAIGFASGMLFLLAVQVQPLQSSLSACEGDRDLYYDEFKYCKEQVVSVSGSLPQLPAEEECFAYDYIDDVCVIPLERVRGGVILPKQRERECVEWNDCPLGSENEGISKDGSTIWCAEPATKENTCSKWNPYDGSCMVWSGGNGTLHYPINRYCLCWSDEPCAEAVK